MCSQVNNKPAQGQYWNSPIGLCLRIFHFANPNFLTPPQEVDVILGSDVYPYLMTSATSPQDVLLLLQKLRWVGYCQVPNRVSSSQSQLVVM
jgi:hypothetical protein